MELSDSREIGSFLALWNAEREDAMEKEKGFSLIDSMIVVVITRCYHPMSMSFTVYWTD